MQIVDITRVVVPEGRQRTVFKETALVELRESIQRRGLIHPIVCQETPEGQFILRAGERRLRAIKDIGMDYKCDGRVIPHDHIPLTLTSELDEIELKELELDENLKRENLTWQEQCQALAEIMALRKAQNPATTTIEVAREISDVTSVPVMTVRRELAQAELVAQQLAAGNDKLKNARSIREAYSIASRDIQAEFEAYGRAALGKTTDHEVYNDDCLKFLPTLQGKQFDCIIADPPYGMGAHEFGTAGPSHEYDDSQASSFEVVSAIAREGYRITKDAAHIYVFCHITFAGAVDGILRKFGWSTFPVPLIWDKGGGAGHNPIPPQAIRRSYEAIIVGWKGDRPALRMITDVIRDIPNVRNSIHAAEKPAALYTHLLNRSCAPGDRVLDPTCGVGPVFEAANALKLRATGIERDKQFFEIASERRYGGPAADAKPAVEPDATEL